MSSPTYHWICHVCEHTNEPGISTCIKCNFPAIASAEEIARVRGEPNPIGEGYRALGTGTGLLAWITAILWPW